MIHDILEHPAALLIIAEHIKRRAGRRKQNIAAGNSQRPGKGNRFFERFRMRYMVVIRGQKLFFKLRRRRADQYNVGDLRLLPDMLCQRFK